MELKFQRLDTNERSKGKKGTERGEDTWGGGEGLPVWIQGGSDSHLTRKRTARKVRKNREKK